MSYQIPVNAQKPADGRYRDGRSASAHSKRWLKWNDDVIGVITSGGGVTFTSLEYNEVVGLYTRGRSMWIAHNENEKLNLLPLEKDVAFEK